MLKLRARIRMKYSTKIDLKSAYNPIETNGIFNKTTAINAPIALLNWNNRPFSIKTLSHIFQKKIKKKIGER